MCPGFWVRAGHLIVNPATSKNLAMEHSIRAYKELESFQTLSLYQDNLFAAIYASNQILIGNIDTDLNEIVTISPKFSIERGFR